MVTDARSDYLSTTNPYIFYQIIVNETATSQDNNTSTINVRVEAWRTNEYTTDRAGICNVKVDGDALGYQEWAHGEKPVSYYSDTEVYDNDVTITHDSDGKKTIHVEAMITFWKDGEIEWDSDYQGFDVTLTDLQPSSQTVQVSITLVSTSSTSVIFDVSTSSICNHWWYVYKTYESETWSEWVEFSTATSKKQRATINGLTPNTLYEIKASARKIYTEIDGYSTTYTAITEGTHIPEKASQRITLFDSDAVNFTTNGLGSLPDALSCNVIEERNGKFELEMVYPITGIRYELLAFRRIIFTKPNQYTNSQPFRIYAISKPLNGRVTVNAAHISYDLSYITVAPFNAGSVTTAFSKMKASADTTCLFDFWTDKSDSGTMQTVVPHSIRSLLGGSEGTILDLYKGEYEFDIFRVKLWESRGTNRGVTLRYGKNLTSLKQDENCSNVYTGVRGYWYRNPTEDSAGVLVETSPKIINVPGTFDYTKILPLDLSNAFEDLESDEVPTQAQLNEKVAQYISDNNIGVPVVSLDVSFVQLSDSEEYKNIALLERVQLCDTVNVEFPKLGVSSTAKCIKTDFNVLTQRYNKIELGSSKSNLASTISSNSKAIQQTASKTEVKSALSYIANKFFGTEGDYVILDYKNNPSRLLCMDSPNKSSAKEVWKWDLDGLSHSSNGVGGPYTVAITMGGAINTAFLKLGQINGNMIREGTVTKGSISSEYTEFIGDNIAEEVNLVRDEFMLADAKLAEAMKQAYTALINEHVTKLQDQIDDIADTTEDASMYHLGFYLDSNGGLCQVNSV